VICKNKAIVISDVLTVVIMKSPVFCLLKDKERFGGVAACLMLVSCLAYFSNVKMETIYFTGTSTDFERTAF
jgi:hypothetical protein